MDVKVRRVAKVTLELDESDAELIAADLNFLLEHTKNLPGVVRMEEAPFVVESQERLTAFMKALAEVVMKKGRGQ